MEPWEVQPADTVLLAIGEIGISQYYVYLPQGCFPLKQTTWIIQDRTTQSEDSPYAIVHGDPLRRLLPLGLLFLLIKERTIQGYAEVSVEGPRFRHVTQVPISIRRRSPRATAGHYVEVSSPLR